MLYRVHRPFTTANNGQLGLLSELVGNHIGYITICPGLVGTSHILGRLKDAKLVSDEPLGTVNVSPSYGKYHTIKVYNRKTRLEVYVLRPVKTRALRDEVEGSKAPAVALTAKQQAAKTFERNRLDWTRVEDVLNRAATTIAATQPHGNSAEFDLAMAELRAAAANALPPARGPWTPRSTRAPRRR
jgi:hypothetical protein